MKLFKYMKQHKAASFVFALLLSGIGVFALVNAFAGTGTGVAYDWKKGEILNNYHQFSSMPEGWDFVSFGYESVEDVEDGASFGAFGFWSQIGTPMIGSRVIIQGDKGDDVLALQQTMNLVRSEDKKDPFYFDQLDLNSTSDVKTVSAIKALQSYFGYDKTGSADLNFQASLYEMISTPEE